MAAKKIENLESDFVQFKGETAEKLEENNRKFDDVLKAISDLTASVGTLSTKVDRIQAPNKGLRYDDLGFSLPPYHSESSRGGENKNPSMAGTTMGTKGNDNEVETGSNGAGSNGAEHRLRKLKMPIF